jgi:FkbM family methyltransferase
MLRKKIKRWLYGSCPGFAGSFPYFGTSVHFPPSSPSFLAACEQGIFEQENVRILQALVTPDSWLFDVGANIGLMSVPILAQNSSVRVASFEPSPNALPWLTRTISGSRFRDRWTLFGKAVGSSVQEVTFYLASKENSWFEGSKPTGRAPSIGTVEVEQTTIDTVWQQLSKPAVSAIKTDVEGGELGVLQGSVACLQQCRPCVLLEWNRTNLAAHGTEPRALLDFASKVRYRVLALPQLATVNGLKELDLHMVTTESFLLVPRADDDLPSDETHYRDRRMVLTNGSCPATLQDCHKIPAET